MKLNIATVFILACQLFLGIGCTHLSSLSTTAIPAHRDRPVRAEASRFIVLALNFDNDYVNDLSMQLAQQCPNGKVTGILTKHESIVYFPLLFHKVRVSADGYCVAGNSIRSKRGPVRRGRGVSSETPVNAESPADPGEVEESH